MPPTSTTRPNRLNNVSKMHFPTKYICSAKREFFCILVKVLISMNILQKTDLIPFRNQNNGILAVFFTALLCRLFLAYLRYAVSLPPRIATKILAMLPLFRMRNGIRLLAYKSVFGINGVNSPNFIKKS